MKKLWIPLMIVLLLSPAYAQVPRGVSGSTKTPFSWFRSLFKNKLGIIGENNAGVVDSRVCSEVQYKCPEKTTFNVGEPFHLCWEIETWTCEVDGCRGCFFYAENICPEGRCGSGTWDCSTDYYTWWPCFSFTGGRSVAGDQTFYVDVWNCRKKTCGDETAWHTRIRYDIKILCTSDSQCPSGYICRSGNCEPLGTTTTTTSTTTTTPGRVTGELTLTFMGVIGGLSILVVALALILMR